MGKTRLYISFHGGIEEGHSNNIRIFKRKGKIMQPSVLLNTDSLPKQIALRGLRDFVIGPDGKLYVANSYKLYNQILRFHSTLNAEGQLDFDTIFAQYHHHFNPAMIHPFQMAFCSNNNLLVSCQGTNTIIALHGPFSENVGQPMSTAAAYIGHQNCFAGTLVPADAEYLAKGSLNKVRGIAFGPKGNLYVADEKNNAVALYDPSSGVFLRNIVDETNCKELDEPVHLLFDGTLLYIGNKNKNNVLRIDTAQANAKVEVFIANTKGLINAPSGMCFVERKSGRRFLLGNRMAQEILQYKIVEGKAIFEKKLLLNLKDNPQFLRLFSLSSLEGAKE